MSGFPGRSSSSGALGSNSKPPRLLRLAGVAQHDTTVRGVMPFPGTLTGVLAAGVWKPIVSVMGAGVLNYARIQIVSAAIAGTFSYRVMIDGREIVSGSTTTTTATLGVDLVGLGVYSAAAGAWVTFSLDQLPFNSSFSIEVMHSAGETDRRAVYYQFREVEP